MEFVEKETFAHGSISWALDRIDQASPVLDGQSNSNGDGQGVNIYSLDTGNLYTIFIYLRQCFLYRHQL